LPPGCSDGRPIITNSPDRNRKLSGRSMAKLNSRSVQRRVHRIGCECQADAAAGFSRTAASVMKSLGIKALPLGDAPGRRTNDFF
jgi:hypothetical protein